MKKVPILGIEYFDISRLDWIEWVQIQVMPILNGILNWFLNWLLSSVLQAQAIIAFWIAGER